MPGAGGFCTVSKDSRSTDTIATDSASASSTRGPQHLLVHQHARRDGEVTQCQGSLSPFSVGLSLREPENSSRCPEA